MLPANDTSFTEILDICEAWLVWVTAFNSAGESSPSNTINVAGPCDPLRAMVPNVYGWHYVEVELTRFVGHGFLTFHAAWSA